MVLISYSELSILLGYLTWMVLAVQSTEQTVEYQRGSFKSVVLGQTKTTYPIKLRGFLIYLSAYLVSICLSDLFLRCAAEMYNISPKANHNLKYSIM